MEISSVYDLIDRFENSNIASMKLEMEGMKLSLSREPAPQNKAEYGLKNRDDAENNDYLKHREMAENKYASGNGDIAGNKDVFENKDIAGSIENKKDKPTGYEVKAPLSGIFYTASTPDAESFVNVGMKVTKGDVIGIIEAMKMMNEVTAPVDGEVIEINASNDEMVGYDQVLVTIKES